MIEEKQIREALQTVMHPKLKKSLIDIGMIRNISIKDNLVTLTLALKSDRFPLRATQPGDGPSLVRHYSN